MKARREISTTRKIGVLKGQIETWRNTHYAASINYEVGETIGDQRMMEVARTNVHNALIAIDLLGKKIAELSETDNVNQEENDEED